MAKFVHCGDKGVVVMTQELFVVSHSQIGRCGEEKEVSQVSGRGCPAGHSQVQKKTFCWLLDPVHGFVTVRGKTLIKYGRKFLHLRDLNVRTNLQEEHVVEPSVPVTEGIEAIFIGKE